ncbi:MAG: nucleotidyltransferase domain-containing protein [Vicinamibacterales bacterium]
MKVHRLDDPALAALQSALRDELDRRPDVCFAYLFGSTLEPLGFRDVDVAVWTTPETGRFADVELANLLTARIGLPVDVRRINEAPGSFLFHVLRGRLLVVRDERLLADLLERTARDYHDLAPLRRRAVADAFAA